MEVDNRLAVESLREMYRYYNDPLSLSFYRQIERRYIAPQFPNRFPDISHFTGGPLPAPPTVAEFVTNIVEETKLKTADIKFESHAFKALQDYKKCSEASDLNGWVCIAALLIELASILVPLARSNADKKKGD